VSRAADDDGSDAPAAERPSKSARKRAAEAAQDFGETLLGLRDAELVALALPPELLEALRTARHITSRAAAVRQRQFIGKLMRTVDVAPLRAALKQLHAPAARAAAEFRRAEEWRSRLLADGEDALEALAREYPDIDRPAWRTLVASARAAPERAAGRGAARELFRALRTLFATMP